MWLHRLPLPASVGRARTAHKPRAGSQHMHTHTQIHTHARARALGSVWLFALHFGSRSGPLCVPKHKRSIASWLHAECRGRWASGV